MSVYPTYMKTMQNTRLEEDMLVVDFFDEMGAAGISWSSVPRHPCPKGVTTAEPSEQLQGRGRT